MADSLDDAGLGPSMLDLMSQTLSRQVVEVAGGFGGLVGINGDDLVGMGTALLPSALRVGVNPGQWTGGARSDTSLSSTMQPLGGESGLGSFTAPICDLFIEVFDLKENNWLRRQAIVIILQQVLGGTIERFVGEVGVRQKAPLLSVIDREFRKFRDTFKNLSSPESVEKTLASFQDMMWQDGVRRPPSEKRSDVEKEETKLRAGKKLGLLIPGTPTFLGRSEVR